jgi:hypothetical protein
VINHPPRLEEGIRINPTLAQLDRLTQRPKMINEMCADVLTTEHPETSAGH